MAVSIIGNLLAVKTSMATNLEVVAASIPDRNIQSRCDFQPPQIDPVWDGNKITTWGNNGWLECSACLLYTSQLSFAIEKILHTDTFQKMTFPHVLKVVN